MHGTLEIILFAMMLSISRHRFWKQWAETLLQAQLPQRLASYVVHVIKVHAA